MEFASNGMVSAQKRETFGAESFDHASRSYEINSCLLAEIQGIPSNPNEWNDADVQRWLRGCIDGYQLCEEDLPQILDMGIEDLLKGVNAAEFDKAFGDVCGDVIANDLLMRMQLADPKAKPTDGFQELLKRGTNPSESNPASYVTSGLPRVPNLSPSSVLVPQHTPVRPIQQQPTYHNPFYPQMTTYPPACFHNGYNHVINPPAVGFTNGALPSMSAFRDRKTLDSGSQSPAETKVFSYSNQVTMADQQMRSSVAASSGGQEQFMSSRLSPAAYQFGPPVSRAQRSGSLMSVSSLESNSPSDWTSEDEVSPFVESDDSLAPRGGSLVDGNVGNNSALPRITLSPQSSGEQFGQPFRRMPDGSGLVAIPINPKTGKPKRKRRKKMRGEIIPPPRLPNRSSCTLWEFFLELLSDPGHYSRLISWLDKENGEFKIIDSEVVSVIWGLLKNKTGMKYDHMSRSIRYYYGKEILDKVPEKQLVYRFGVNSNWLNYLPKSLGVDESRMPKTPIQICGRVAKPKHFAVARVSHAVS